MKTTKEDFELFKKECRKWINMLSLHDFTYEFKHERLEDNYAQVLGLYSGKSYLITLSTDFIDDMTITRKKEIIKESAFHESMECLLYRLRCQCADRKFDEEEVDSEIHGIIHRLQHVLFEKGNVNE